MKDPITKTKVVNCNTYGPKHTDKAITCLLLNRYEVSRA